MRTTPIVLAGIAAAMLAVGTAQAQQQRLPRACVKEIVQLCGSDRSKMRACLREKYSELSESCAKELRERVQQQQRGGQARGRQSRSETRMASQDFDLVTYGAHERQAVDFYAAPDAAANPPLVLFVHGGGWSFGNRTQTVQQKPAHFTARGYAFASAGYRVLPHAPVEEQAGDVAAAIARLRADAGTLGFDPDRIVLMGHSAGAHLAALVATDPHYAGDDLASIRAVVLLDGAGYDVPANMARSDLQLPRIYENAFGTDPARQAALSPITHVGAPDAPNWLILHVADRAQSRDQSQALAARLASAGASADAVPISGTDHGRLNRELGSTGDAATARVDAFLAEVFG